MWDAWDARQLEALQRCVTPENVNTTQAFGHGYKVTLLENVTERGFIQCVRWLCEEMHANLHGSVSSGVYFKQHACVQYLIERGAHADGDDLLMNIPGDDVKMIQLLIDLGVTTTTHVQSKLSNTVYVAACIQEMMTTWNAMEMTRLLMYYGARIDIKTDGNLSELKRDNKMPAWAYEMQIEQDKITREQYCIPAAAVLLYALRRRGCCPSMARHVISTYILASFKEPEWLFPQKNRK